MADLCGCTPLKNFRMIGKNEARCLNCGGLIAWPVQDDPSAAFASALFDAMARRVDAEIMALVPKPSAIVADFLRSIPGVKP